MKLITLELTDEAYHSIRDALNLKHESDDRDVEPMSVREWIQHELNNNTEAIIEMLLTDW